MTTTIHPDPDLRADGLPITAPAWQTRPMNNDRRQALLDHLDWWMVALGRSMNLDTNDPDQRLTLIQRLAVWTGEARMAAHDELGPDHDPLDGQPF